jgi:hypothetical protein
MAYIILLFYPFRTFDADPSGLAVEYPCGRSFAGIEGSNLAEAMGCSPLVFVAWVATTATESSIAQRSPTRCVCVCLIVYDLKRQQ